MTWHWAFMMIQLGTNPLQRSEERRVGKECGLVMIGAKTLRVCTKHLLHLFPIFVMITKPIMAFQITKFMSLAGDDRSAN